jgi:hypothetical protein
MINVLELVIFNLIQGSNLLLPNLKTTDQNLIPTYLISYSEKSIKFFIRLGFKETICFSSDLNVLDTITCMKRVEDELFEN